MTEETQTFKLIDQEGWLSDESNEYYLWFLLEDGTVELTKMDNSWVLGSDVIISEEEMKYFEKITPTKDNITEGKMKEIKTFKLIDKEGWFSKSTANQENYSLFSDEDTIEVYNVFETGNYFSKGGGFLIIGAGEMKYFEEVSISLEESNTNDVGTFKLINKKGWLRDESNEDYLCLFLDDNTITLRKKYNFWVHGHTVIISEEEMKYFEKVEPSSAEEVEKDSGVDTEEPTSSFNIPPFRDNDSARIVPEAETDVYSGTSASYYRIFIDDPTTKGIPPYWAECNDMIEALEMTYAEANVFKSVWRLCAARLGKTKKGYTDGVYDAEKSVMFSKRMLIKEIKKRESKT